MNKWMDKGRGEMRAEAVCQWRMAVQRSHSPSGHLPRQTALSALKSLCCAVPNVAATQRHTSLQKTRPLNSSCPLGFFLSFFFYRLNPQAQLPHLPATKLLFFLTGIVKGHFHSKQNKYKPPCVSLCCPQIHQDSQPTCVSASVILLVIIISETPPPPKSPNTHTHTHTIGLSLESGWVLNWKEFLALWVDNPGVWCHQNRC